MKTFLKVAGLGLLTVALAGYFILAFAIGAIVKNRINRVGPGMTQSRFELAGASISPLRGSATLTGLSVGNPAGWSDHNAFYLGQVSIDFEPRTLFGELIVINEILIDQPEFLYETRLINNNIKELLKNVEAHRDRKAPGDTKDGPPRKYIVKKLRLTNGKVRVGVSVAALPLSVPDITLENLGVEEGGITGGRIAGAVLREVLGNIVKATPGAIVKLPLNVGEASLEKTKEAAQDVGDAVKDLFRKKP